MGTELVTISVGGLIWSGFERIDVRAAFNEAARSFTMDVAAELGASATNAIFGEGVDVAIFFNGDLVLTGIVDCREPEFEGESALITVSGRSRSADLIDGSAEHATGRFENKDPKEIGDEIARDYRARFETDQQLDKIEQYQLTPGESCFRCVEKLARQQGMTLSGTAEGNIRITKAGNERHAGGLIEGVNMLRGRASHNGANRHSKYVVRGQRPFGHGDENVQIEAEVDDDGVDRHRPIIIVEDEDTTKQRAKRRARNRRDRAAGDALKATITVQGFRDDAGKVWEPGWLVWVESPFLDIAQDMLIESIAFTQSERGSVSVLSLTDPRSYGGQGSKGKGNKSGAEWNFPEDI